VISTCLSSADSIVFSKISFFVCPLNSLELNFNILLFNSTLEKSNNHILKITEEKIKFVEENKEKYNVKILWIV